MSMFAHRVLYRVRVYRHMRFGQIAALPRRDWRTSR
jgi:hypothetical protein